MKKLLTLFLLSFFLFTTNAVYANKSYTCDDLAINITLLPNGQAIIMEKWTFTYKGDSFSCFIRNIPIDADAPISNITVYENNKSYSRLPALTKKDPPDHFAVGKNSKDYIIETYFYAKNQTRTFTLVYTMANAVIIHDDIAEFYNKLISDFDIPINQLSTEITIPDGANSDDVRIWAHGPLNGNIEKIADNKILAKVENVPRKTFVEVRATMPTALFPNATYFSHKKALAGIIAEETKWADEANKQRENEQKRKQYVTIAIVTVLATYVLITLGFLYNSYKTVKKRRQYLPKSKPKYYRELPSDLSPAEVNSLLYYIKIFGAKKGSLAYSATLLNLYLKDHLDIVETVDKGFFFDTNELSLSLGTNQDTNQLKGHERIFFGLIKSALSGHQTRTIEQIRSYFQSNAIATQNIFENFDRQVNQKLEKDNYLTKDNSLRFVKRPFLIFIFFITFSLLTALLLFVLFDSIILLLLSPFIPVYPFYLIMFIKYVIYKKYRPTEKGTVEIVLWQGFKNFLQDFTLFDEKELPDLTVWENYLVYAVALGEGDKLFEKLKLKYPELTATTTVHSASRLSKLNTISNNSSLFNSFNNMGKSLSNFSSGSGGGGGFSGGGGGGRGGGGGGCR